ncbi:hypothetical protein GIB67_034951 [Kingdonia uniflora]|uniref:Uncharacterized protein n=1 Tax=Kingdonia uniflora TaxID=39325 RepID=A0A7J7NHC1_9MAGN|nr:hypothetical protein GIB67_034951 [Kingdonia uniflora]
MSFSYSFIGLELSFAKVVGYRQDINPHLIPWFKAVSQTLSFVYGVVGKDTTDDFEDVGHSSSVRTMMDYYYVEEIDSSTKQKSTSFKQPQYNQDIRLQTIGKNICA